MTMTADKYLSGKFLISMPGSEDDCFAQSVIYICSHSQEGAMGFVINKKLKDFSFSDLAVKLPDVHNKSFLESMFLYQGGPLEKIRGFVLHTSDYQKPGTFRIDSNISISSSLDILTDIAYGSGPKENLIALGYSGWEPNQLERELLENRWLIAPANPELMFNTPDEWKWERAIEESGLDLNRFIPHTGWA